MQLTLKFFGWLLLVATVQVATAADFRIESRVYAEKEKEPVSKSTTLFKAGMAYDFLEEPRETTVLDPQRQRIILLDATNKLKTEIGIAKIVEFTAQMKLRAAGNEDELLKFLAEPTFTETWNPQGDELTLSSDLMTYKVLPLKAPAPEVSHQYHYFSNWYAQLNAMTHVAGLPPFARAKLDDVLDQRELLPKTVELTVSVPSRFGRRDVKLRSEHEFAWKLLNKDERLITDTHAAMAAYRQVSFDEFQQRAAALQAKRK